MNEPGDRPPIVEPDGERPPVVAPGEHRSVVDDARDLFLDPAATFRHVRRDPRALPPLVLVVTAASLAMVVVLLGMGAADAMDRVREASGLPGGTWANVAVTAFGVIAVAIGLPLTAAVSGALLWAWATLRDAAPDFTVVFVAMLWIQLLEPVQAIADALAARLAGRALDTVTIGPTLFVSPDSVSPAVYGALAYVNVFGLWGAILVGVAAVHAVGLGRRDAVAFAIGLWALGLALTTAAAAAGGMQAPSAPAGPSL